ncbi:MAG TPA: Spy/CpxP family protein refolding chaperone [Thermoanaerobaculia bacterium]|jgi:Spy/CpxP family protein refolding chaperone
MYPGFIPHWKRRHCGSRGDRSVHVGVGFADCETEEGGWEFHTSPEDAEGGFGFGFSFGGGAFGVRRPLRFLAFKLHLSEAQVAELARILDAIKTERAQAAVDLRRTLSSFAEAIEGDTFDAAKANAGASLRMQSAERLKDAVVTALGELHRLLDPEQRKLLAYLIRTGTLSL